MWGNHFAPDQSMFYGIVVGSAGCRIIRTDKGALGGPWPRISSSRLDGRADKERKTSISIYGVATPLPFWHSFRTRACYVIVGIKWLIPDPRIESTLAQQPDSYASTDT
jgi:hypothetical protein